ncbi:ATP-binding cassette domain-containing protein [Verminephrobacter aporrectodeae subsp. tuberculatae]|uniref:Quaternary amine transport ATP-binding protein n=1 Tax=Verminephrobacter aporrectodeae subsp. tuberculatae TaxID=1110392 RepID=A0ABT3KU39_9BURK|nr:betaine/proline/choline family ABC transporter ATP-binding protein [Verminephrobacter aporrectodeae]MCW5222264.1 ATP-binding cassette domain-containing protein [Verminephrobacter aporrectodeae subsp. tuberculatae]MCW5257540.1 ATP-binding cassette domain-containing protein [Verminephrobacter aporrectodeae subsp. tuberculatae]MCW5287728.1 ATP-binding cassette domain-containing protein [Verminephrobacter aporrectodeae subsp. tuberculatae]MCW5321290.1 ATP-binding cassette domain-containing prote
MPDPKISVKNLCKVFGDNVPQAIELLDAGRSKDEIFAQTGNVVGVNRVSFAVQPGEIYVLMGLSGSGKSTLVRLINRLVEPSRGSINVDGLDIAALSRAELVKWRRRRVAMVFQSFALMPHRNVLANAALGLEMAGTPRKAREARAMEVLAQVGLQTYAAKYPAQLSGGMQQRVGLARALAVDPEILLMDEAFSALDPLKRVEMQSLLLDLQRAQQRTVIFVSHDLEEALRIGTRIAIMESGNLVQEGSAHQIITQPANAYVRKFFEGIDTSRYLTAADLIDPGLNGHSYGGGPRLPWSTPLPEAMQTVLGIDQPIGVFDATDRLLGCISARSLLARMSQEARHV